MVAWFFKGGTFMWPILFVFMGGLVFVVERFFSLVKTTVQTKSFLKKVDVTLKEQGVDEEIITKIERVIVKANDNG